MSTSGSSSTFSITSFATPQSYSIPSYIQCLLTQDSESEISIIEPADISEQLFAIFEKNCVSCQTTTTESSSTGCEASPLHATCQKISQLLESAYAKGQLTQSDQEKVAIYNKTLLEQASSINKANKSKKIAENSDFFNLNFLLKDIPLAISGPNGKVVFLLREIATATKSKTTVSAVTELFKKIHDYNAFLPFCEKLSATLEKVLKIIS